MYEESGKEKNEREKTTRWTPYLKEIVVLEPQRARNPRRDEHRVREVRVRHLVQLLRMIYPPCISLPPRLHARRDAHLGMTSAWPFASGPMSRNENLCFISASLHMVWTARARVLGLEQLEARDLACAGGRRQRGRGRGGGERSVRVQEGAGMVKRGAYLVDMVEEDEEEDER
jgi:hypothetical protein